MTDKPPIHGTHTAPIPFDELTEIADRVTQELDGVEGVQYILMLHDQEGRGGVKIGGYEDQVAAAAAIFVHMKAMLNSTGRDLQFIGIPETPEGLDQS